jgi:uncharacterized membrane protein
MPASVAQALACICLIALVFLCLLWESVLAPIRPGGSWLMLKALPLLVPLFGLLHGKLYTYRWTCLLTLPYFCEGVVRAWAERDLVRVLAWTELALALSLLASAMTYVYLKRNRPPRQA